MFISNQLLKKSNYRIEDKKVIAFQSNVVLKNLQKMQADVFVKESAFTSFISQVSKSYPQEKTMDVIFKSLVPQNFLGSGRCAKVYEIPHVKDFVVRVLHNVKPESLVKCEIKPVKDEFPNYNFGQKIADNGEGVTILKRVLGVSQSFPEPREKDKSGVFKVVHSQTVLQQIVEMAKFPQESFDDFALKVKEINKSPKYMLDCLNPNNLLVDKENQRFNVVDLAERKNFVALAGFKQDSSDMISLLLNVPFHRKVYDVLPTLEEKDLLLSSSKTIMNKIYRAAVLTNLGKSNKTGEERLAIMQDYCLKKFDINYMLLERYRGFCELYQK